MSKVIHELGDLLYEDGKLIYSANPSECICCGGVAPGVCCVFAADVALCVPFQGSTNDPIAEPPDGSPCSQCHTQALPSGWPNYPANPDRNVWYSISYGYDLSTGDWHIEVGGCPFWFDPGTGRTYWPPVPSGTPTISSTTAANAVQTSFTITDTGCTKTSNSNGCWQDVYNCTSLSMRWEGTSTPPTCTNCPECNADAGEGGSDRWSFSGFDTPPGSGGSACGGNPWTMANWKFGIDNCPETQLPSVHNIGSVCNECP